MKDSIWVLRTTRIRLSAASCICPEATTAFEAFKTVEKANDALHTHMKAMKNVCETHRGSFMILRDETDHKIVLDDGPDGTSIIYDYRIMEEGIY